LSSNGKLDGDSVAQSGAVHNQGAALAPGASYTVTGGWFNIGNSGTVPGTYTVFVKADGHSASLGGTNTDSGSVTESDETNNAIGASVTLARPDLKISGLVIGTITANQDGSWFIPLSYTVTNVGTIAAQPGWNDVAYLSSNGKLDGDSVAQSGAVHNQGAVLAPGASYTVTGGWFNIGNSGTVPGTYTVFVKADGHSASLGGTNTDGGSVTESDETNNAMGVPIVLSR
jgi:uncharacterized protein affecting Mg2+/Co2+ transport